MSGETFERARIKLGMSKGDIAECFGVTKRAVQYWEDDQRRIPELVARIICAALENRIILDLIFSNRLIEMKSEEKNG